MTRQSKANSAKTQIRASRTHPPLSDDAIDQQINALCEKLKHNDPPFSSFEIKNGLMDYLRIVASIASNAQTTTEKSPSENDDQLLDSNK